MLNIKIPAYKDFTFKYLVLDFNGTVAVNGKISDNVKEKLNKISEFLEIYVITADTYGTAKKECVDINLQIKTFENGFAVDEKLNVLNSLGKEKCICMGNGRNDIEMCKEAEISICVMGEEGCYSKLLGITDLTVTSIDDALDLILNPKRIQAGLRG